MRKYTCIRVLITFLSILCLSLIDPSANAQVPATINYQGRLLDGTNLVSGNVGLAFRLYNVASGGVSLYEDSNTVAVADGLYDTFIGDNTVFGSLVSTLTNSQVWLEIAVDGTALAPRERLVGVPYAMATRGLLVATNGSIVLSPETNSIDVASAFATVGGGRENTIGPDAKNTVIGGGLGNDVLGDNEAATIAGGRGNDIGTNSSWSSIGGGFDNDIAANSEGSVIAGGRFNKITPYSTYAFIGGGQGNSVVESNDYAVLVGGRNNRIGMGAIYTVVGGGSNNTVGANSLYATIAGGRENVIGTNAGNAAIGGGHNNTVGNSSPSSVIAGGRDNDIGTNASFAVIGGGSDNNVLDNSSFATVVGGVLNDIGPRAAYSIIAGGFDNNVESDSRYASIAGGAFNAIGTNSEYAAIGGGSGNVIGPNAAYSFAAGRRAVANHSGVFIWGDNLDADVVSGSSNQAIFRSSGGFRIYTSAVLTSGVQVAAGSGTWTSLSDVNAKENFREIDGEDVLAKLAAIPVREWNYKTQDASVRHIGPTAQDFHAAFGVGDSETGISVVDADGVALAAIQALDKERARMEEKMSGLEEENARLREELEAIKRVLGL